MDTRADGYASTRTADELTQVRNDLTISRAHAKPGSLADRLAAAYGHALTAETDQRDGDRMTITQTAALAGNLRNAEPYMCSCGDTFSGLALLETHLDLLGDDTDTHVELAVVGDLCKRQVALGIRRFRLERGLPMRAMGALLGVNVSTISRIESGERRFGYLLVNPRVTAALLGISLVDLLRPCPKCGYKPLAGYLCQTCGTYGETA